MIRFDSCRSLSFFFCFFFFGDFSDCSGSSAISWAWTLLDFFGFFVGSDFAMLSGYLGSSAISWAWTLLDFFGFFFVGSDFATLFGSSATN